MPPTFRHGRRARYFLRSTRLRGCMNVSSGPDAMRLARIKRARLILASGGLSLALALGLGLMSLAAHAAEETRSRPQAPLSMGFRFLETTGEELFASACQACHMPDGKGAVGAGTYPSLVQDSKLEAGGYPVYV